MKDRSRRDAQQQNVEGWRATAACELRKIDLFEKLGIGDPPYGYCNADVVERYGNDLLDLRRYLRRNQHRQREALAITRLPRSRRASSGLNGGANPAPLGSPGTVYPPNSRPFPIAP